MMLPTLRLCEDVLSNDSEMSLPAHPRMIFVVHGAIAIADRILRRRGDVQRRNRRDGQC